MTILLVEDNPSHAELIMRSFEEHRVANKIIHLTNGADALDYLFARGRYAGKAVRPHMILLDLRIPRVDGLEVLRQIKTDEALSRIPVVVLTTSGAERDVARAYEHHANGYVIKPVDFAKFTRLMDELGFFWLGWNYHPWS